MKKLSLNFKDNSSPVTANWRNSSPDLIYVLMPMRV